ncbi:MAG: hypothetical protein R6U19_07050 [Bacteroidales bacterium]
MKKAAIIDLFRKMRRLHTTLIIVMVFLMLIIYSYVYHKTALLTISFDTTCLYLIISAIISLASVFYVENLTRKKMPLIPAKSSLKEKLFFYRRIYGIQITITAMLIQLNTIAYLVLGNSVFFIMAFAVLVFLLTIKPSAEKFLKNSVITKEEEALFK